MGHMPCLPLASSQDSSEVLGLPMEGLIARQRLKAEGGEEEGGEGESRGDGPELPRENPLREARAEAEEIQRKRPAEGEPPRSSQTGSLGKEPTLCDSPTPLVQSKGEKRGEVLENNGLARESDLWVQIKPPPRVVFTP